MEGLESNLHVVTWTPPYANISPGLSGQSPVPPEQTLQGPLNPVLSPGVLGPTISPGETNPLSVTGPPSGTEPISGPSGSSGISPNVSPILPGSSLTAYKLNVVYRNVKTEPVPRFEGVVVKISGSLKSNPILKSFVSGNIITKVIEILV